MEPHNQRQCVRQSSFPVRQRCPFRSCPTGGTTLKSFTCASPRPHRDVDFEGRYRPTSGNGRLRRSCDSRPVGPSSVPSCLLRRREQDQGLNHGALCDFLEWDCSELCSHVEAQPLCLCPPELMEDTAAPCRRLRICPSMFRVLLRETWLMLIKRCWNHPAPLVVTTPCRWNAVYHTFPNYPEDYKQESKS